MTAHTETSTCQPAGVESAHAKVVPFAGQPLDTIEHENIDRLEDAIVEAFPGLDLDEFITHRFGGGIYAREMFIPAGTIVVSMIHKEECVSTCSSGAIWVWAAGMGEGFKLVEAPFTAVTPPGTRRVGIADRDTVWTTYHPTESTDVEEIERELYDARSLERREELERRSRELREARGLVPEMVKAMSTGDITKCLVQ